MVDVNQILVNNNAVETEEIRQLSTFLLSLDFYMFNRDAHLITIHGHLNKLAATSFKIVVDMKHEESAGRTIP